MIENVRRQGHMNDPTEEAPKKNYEPFSYICSK